ncbi:DHA2 family efflux MFS transporter permease subunit [Nitratireductor sp. L1-7-SE]|uniref:DHA2 family efflux MFS transporter permease subunit n=1 Tax=Nitratireductor rhodophyticola TaxID=2854036 RepID=A0ABS7RE67_9HYPH|nr:DHA2 family efflux MFS transporter permease subunit [Nitratireductor rhodophyticola]MBY8920870.1 DHA2 family efflux MFS transporter permease subunit [Nitratireductor rhodophyticola]
MRTACPPTSSPGRPAQEQNALNRTLPLILAVALFMEQMDSTVIATSLPAIAADIGTSPVTLKLALTSYLVSLAIFIPISGFMADRFGAKRVFRIAIAVFVIGSIACAFSNSLGAFVLSRFLQGMGGAMMTPVGRLVLVRAVPREQLVKAMAWLTVPALIGPIAGPPLGGFVTTYFSWHWIFLINVPIGLLGIVVSGYVLPDFAREETGRLDLSGFLLCSIGASGLVFGLSVISLPALPPVIGLVTVVIGVMAAALYVRHALRTPRPILNLSLFANRTFRAAIIGGSLFRIGVGAVPFLLPLMFQVVFGLTPFQSGLLTFASAFGAIAMKFIATTALRLGGFRVVLVTASVLGGASIAVNALFTPATPHWVIITVLVGSGLLRSLFFTSANALVFAELGDREASQASTISAAAQQVSIALGVAVGGGILEASAFITGTELGIDAFVNAFLIVAALSALAAVPFLTLPPEAGSRVSGHSRRRGRLTEPAPAGE